MNKNQHEKLNQVMKEILESGKRLECGKAYRVNASLIKAGLVILDSEELRTKIEQLIISSQYQEELQDRLELMRKDPTESSVHNTSYNIAINDVLKVVKGERIK